MKKNAKRISKSYSEQTIVERLHSLISNSVTCRIAVAYCGEKAYEFFPESPALWPPDLRIVVDASEPAVTRGLTNPKGLEHLLSLTKQLKSLEGLHSKVFIFDDHSAIVGSVNLSESSITQQFQLSVEVSDQELVHEIISWFDETIWKQGKEVDSKVVEKLRTLWPTKDFQFPAKPHTGKVAPWHGKAPKRQIESSDLTIGISNEELASLLKEFKSNKCGYSTANETCFQHSAEADKRHDELSNRFHALMTKRSSWDKNDAAAVFDLAFTNGKAAQIGKPRFLKLAPARVGESLGFLLEGPGDPYVRFEKLANPTGKYKLDGLGQVGLAFLMHLWRPKEFPVLSKPINDALRVLKVRFKGGFHDWSAKAYRDRAAVISQIALKTELGSFAGVDHFLDAIGKGHIGPLR